MKIWRVKAPKITGSSPREIVKKAKAYSSLIESSTKRWAYIKSKYFKSKVFLKYFWEHLYQTKNWKQRAKRLSFFLCAIELIEKSPYSPISQKQNRNKRSEILYRFVGVTQGREVFYVQIKQSKDKQKFFMSVFPK